MHFLSIGATGVPVKRFRALSEADVGARTTEEATTYSEEPSLANDRHDSGCDGN